MEGLLKRISAEGSEAENALRVVAFFDELVAHRSPLDALVRSTARLIGAPAGYESQSGGLSWGFDQIGRPYNSAIPTAARSQRVTAERGLSGTAWILPETSNHALADLVLERMALAAAIVLGRDSGEGAHAEENSLSRLLDTRNSAEDRRLDAQLLGFRSNWNVRVAAFKQKKQDQATVSAQVSAWSRSIGVKATSPTLDSGLCVTMIHDTGHWTVDDFASWGCLVGLGASEVVEDAHRSLDTARRALRLCSWDLGPAATDYAALGPLQFVTSVTPDVASQDDTVKQLSALLETETGTAELMALDAYCRNTSLRTAASELRLHHSSLANRLDNVARKIGRDLSDPEDRFAVALSLQLLRVSRAE